MTGRGSGARVRCPALTAARSADAHSSADGSSVRGGTRAGAANRGWNARPDLHRRDGASPRGRLPRQQIASSSATSQRLFVSEWRRPAHHRRALTVPTASAPVTDGPAATNFAGRARRLPTGRSEAHRVHAPSLGLRGHAGAGHHPKRQSPSDYHGTLDTLLNGPLRWVSH